MKTRVIDGVCVRRGPANIYADLGLADADKPHIKTGLVIKIRKAIAALGLTHQAAAARMGQPQRKVPDLMRGDFRHLPERKPMDCLTRLA